MPTLLLNKPYEVLTQFTDEHGRATLKDYVPVPGVYPVGRLDYDSEGLLLLTDDKQLQHRLSDPRFKVPKTYHAQVEGLVSEAALGQLRQGVQIKDGFTLPAEAQALPAADPAGPWPRTPPIRYRAAIPTDWLELTISQGMNRQVRKMCAAVGLPCLRLVRVALGPLSLGELAPGQYRELTAAEVQALRGLGQAPAPGPVAGGRRPYPTTQPAAKRRPFRPR
ncbi:pseudouridine synthase [Hymenobacter sp. RP-2-7]|uniref:Pseudouridine synthase n=1 Tax=Hymenobacter polaris TaxID=2682546 RepID=A0A7Y0FL12_9BACT|nr:pseudouridine synthase [Hymenobacter polaris]NML63886.1 pseudouridine synthase [Hymenobacter polaris]